MVLTLAMCKVWNLFKSGKDIELRNDHGYINFDKKISIDFNEGFNKFKLIKSQIPENTVNYTFEKVLKI